MQYRNRRQLVLIRLFCANEYSMYLNYFLVSSRLVLCEHRRKTVKDVASILYLNIMEAILTWIFYICHHAAIHSCNLGVPARLYSFHLCFLCSVSLQLPSLLVASGLISLLTFLCICCLHSLQQPLSIPCS